MQVHQSYLLSAGKILSSEGTTQGYPTVMGTYALGILPLIKFLLEFINLNEMIAKKQVFADDFSVAGSSKALKITRISPKNGHFWKPTKSYVIVKEKIDGSGKFIC